MTVIFEVHCGNCSKPIFLGDKVYTTEDYIFCYDCAPTIKRAIADLQEMIEYPFGFSSEYYESIEDAKEDLQKMNKELVKNPNGKAVATFDSVLEAKIERLNIQLTKGK